MIKIDTTSILRDLSGEALKAEDRSILTLGKAMGTILATHRGKLLDNIKLLILAQNFYKDVEVGLDEADFNAVRDICKGDANLYPLVLGQVEQLLLKAKEKSAVPTKTIN